MVALFFFAKKKPALKKKAFTEKTCTKHKVSRTAVLEHTKFHKGI